ncbi:hypothetical protein DAI22_11g156200 [Oryza sativa Japonica Group]|nr:hypothetical protein DAI22_11g156200 [Oryza sativa Japonica Group]
MQISYSYLKQLNRVDVHGWAPADNDKRGCCHNSIIWHFQIVLVHQKQNEW